MRQDAIETLQRFSGLIIALCTICLGLYWILNSFGLLMIVGYPVTFIGIALGYSATQRLRFHRNTEGQGIVHFVEGQITYFGPESGGIVAVGDITRAFARHQCWQRSPLRCSHSLYHHKLHRWSERRSGALLSVP